MRYKQGAMIAILILILSGCLNPYKNTFSCPLTELGKCVPVRMAYKESVDSAPPSPMPVDIIKKEERFPDPLPDPPILRTSIRRYVQEPAQPPLVKSPKIMRIWVAPYETKDGLLLQERFIYQVTEETKWGLGQ